MPALKKTRYQERETLIKIALTSARINKGWTVKHLSELLGMEISQVSNIINHPLKRELRNLLRVSDKLGVDLLNLK